VQKAEEERQSLYEAQRAKILEGARRAFARKGRAATMADVAAEATVSQGLAYRYFANKEEIVHALLEQTLQNAGATMQRFLEMEGTPWERLSLLIKGMLAHRLEEPEFYQIFDQMRDDHLTPEPQRQMMRKQGQTFLAVMRQLIIEGQASGEVAAGDPEQMVVAILACLDGLSRWAVRTPQLIKEHKPAAEIILRILKA
jgi:AcrR family transcriptional regulator